MKRSPVRRIVLACASAVLMPGTARAQLADGMLPLRFADAAPGTVRFDHAPLNVDGRYILIHLSENRLFLMERNRALWSAPVATGSGFRLERAGRAWQFSTPRGVFRVQRKELDPVWIKPDWAFIEDGEPVPPLDSPLRRQEGMLGTTALYIGYELALHGTSSPELVLRPDPDARRVSHGCIRLTNEDARTLYHLVEVGTPVLIY